MVRFPRFRFPGCLPPLLAALALTSCGLSNNQFPPVCPVPGLVKPVSELARFRPGSQDIRDLVVRAHTDDGRVTVGVEDDGDWRAPSRTDQRGRGLALMHGLMDDVEITAADDGSGTRVTLRRRVGHA